MQKHPSIENTENAIEFRLWKLLFWSGNIGWYCTTDKYFIVYIYNMVAAFRWSSCENPLWIQSFDVLHTNANEPHDIVCAFYIQVNEMNKRIHNIFIIIYGFIPSFQTHYIVIFFTRRLLSLCSNGFIFIISKRSQMLRRLTPDEPISYLIKSIWNYFVWMQQM